MATYKVPQDVEADDKLIGPFSFRQFIYLIIVALAIALAWGLAQLFVGLAIIPIPIIIFFGALALPLRKDQPMEIYMAAMVSFYLKPRLRLWDPEGIETLIEISAPKTIEVQRTKDLSQTEAAQRLSYLANIVDSQGWAIRGVSGTTGTAMNNDVYLEAQGAEDVLDTNTSVAHSFDQMMAASTERMHEEAKQRMIQATMPQPPAPVQVVPTQPGDDPLLAQMSQQMRVTQGAIDPNAPAPQFNPYPTFHQAVIQPLNDAMHEAQNNIEPEEQPVAAPVVASTPAPEPQVVQVAEVQQPVVQEVVTEPVSKPEHKNHEKHSSTSEAAITAGIMNLANNPDLSIETLAHEAQRIKKKAEAEEASDEVVISLR